MSAPRLFAYADEAGFVAAVADVVASRLGEALARRDEASLSLPGGSTPRRYLPAIATLALDWARVWVVPGDERWVAPDSTESNERLICAALMAGPAAVAHRVSLKTAHATPAEALDTLDLRLARLPWPLDLAVLGVGDDGHVASLFPGNTLDGPARVVAGSAPSAPQARVSLSLGALGAARALLLVAGGAHKRALLAAAFAGTGGDLPLARLVASAQGEVQAIVGP